MDGTLVGNGTMAAMMAAAGLAYRAFRVIDDPAENFVI
jgi:hypothetical protein